jgi:outer membrane protein, heavy metal efflux system
MFNRNYLKTITGIGLAILINLALPASLFSQIDTLYRVVNLNYEEYLKIVVSSNLEYAAEKFNVRIADAGIDASAVFQDPILGFDMVKNREEKTFNEYSVSAGVSKTFELGNKRKARINVAKSESSLANALLDEHLRNLLADATIDYLTALKQNFLYDVMLNSYQMMKELSGADSIRLSLGSIKAIDATQSKIEAGILYNNLLQIESDRKRSFLNLSVRTSTYHADTIYSPSGKFDKSHRSFTLNDLITEALNNRADLMAAKSNIGLQHDRLTLTKQEKKADVDLKLGTGNTYLNTFNSTPFETGIFAGIAIPLKFSNLNKGEIKIAQYHVAQGELMYRQVEMKIRNEVEQAYIQYMSLYRQVENFDQGLLDQAKIVLNGKVYSYSRGETSLLEVLNAQRTYNDIQTSYYETLFNSNAALIELERAIGTCKINL